MSLIDDFRRAVRGARVGAMLAVGPTALIKLRRLALILLVAVAVFVFLVFAGR